MAKKLKMTPRAQTPLVQGRDKSENLTFSALLFEQTQNKKALDDETKKHSRTSPDVQFKEFSLTKQKIWTWNGQ